MVQELKKTFSHAAVYTVGVILNRAVSFIMLPIYTRFLTPADYGVLELLQMTVDIITTLTAIGIHQGLFKFYYEYEEGESRKRFVSTIFLLLIGLFFFSSLLFGTFSTPISRIVIGSDEYSGLVMISLANMFFQFTLFLALAYLRVQYKSRLFVIVSSVKLALQLSLNILFVVVLKMGVLGVLLSTFITSLVLGSYLVAQIFMQVGLHFSGKISGKLLRFGAPFIISSYASFILTFSDRFFINYFGGLADVGIYSLAYKFGFLLMTFPIAPIYNVWMVQRFELAEKGDHEDVFNKVLLWFVIITLSVALFISLTIRDVLRIMSAPMFWDAYRYVPIIIFAYFIQACTDFFNFGIYKSGKTTHIAYGTTLSAGVILVLSFLLIPRFGLFGAAWATLAAFACRLAYFYVASQKLFRIRYELGKPIATAGLAILVYMLHLAGLRMFPALENMLASSIFNLALLALFILVLFAFNIVHANEREILFGIVRNPGRTLENLRNP